MSGLTPICVACQVQMRCIKNNRLVRDPEAACGPSTYWYGDEYKCPVCGCRIVTGFGKPITTVEQTLPPYRRFAEEAPGDRTWEEEKATALPFAYEPPPEGSREV